MCLSRVAHRRLSPLLSAPGLSRAPLLVRRAMQAAPASASSSVEVVRVPCLSDNYTWLIHDRRSGQTACVDPADAATVAQALESRGWGLQHILNTHHHSDHVGGNLELKRRYGAAIVGPAADRDRIPGIDTALADGDSFPLFGTTEVKVFDTPGHTRGHVAFWLPSEDALFPGDTLFCLGCGRLFEGTPQQMWASLSKLAALPPQTRVFCAHEYTQSNARFAVTVDPGNEALGRRKQQVDEARRLGQPTVPSTLADELATNPFLRAADPGIRRALGLAEDAEDWRVFAAVRQAKDRF